MIFFWFHARFLRTMTLGGNKKSRPFSDDKLYDFLVPTDSGVRVTELIAKANSPKLIFFGTSPLLG